MKVNKSQSDHCSPITSNEMERFGSTPDFLYGAIENANGVPFQLIFGPHIGDGHYFNKDSGINDVPGIASGDTTEIMIEEEVTLCRKV